VESTLARPSRSSGLGDRSGTFRREAWRENVFCSSRLDNFMPIPLRQLLERDRDAVLRSISIAAKREKLRVFSADYTACYLG
jgi:hypothetical protein